MQDINFKRPNDHFEKLINQLNEDFGPYADTTYGTLLTWWDSFNDLLFAELNGNVLVLSSYPSDGRTKQLSIIGAHEADKTIKMALDWLQDNHLEPMLHFLPEYIIDVLKKDGPDNDYDISADRDISEYVLLAKEQRDLNGGNFSQIRYKINYFKSRYGLELESEYLPLDLNKNNELIFKYLDEWRNKTDNDTNGSEKNVINTSIKLHEKIGMHCMLLTCKKQPIGFVLYKLLPHGHVNVNHIKVDYQYPHVFIYIIHAFALFLEEHYPTFTHINIEQDLGIKGLREFKQLQRPAMMLHKYSLTRHQN